MILPQNIVIVEDEVITQRYLKDILVQSNVNVVGCFDNAIDVMDVIDDISCDMVLMDINIKGATDGIQLARDILDIYNVPIVFITAYSDKETLEEVLDLSPYGFISKPFSSKDIQITLQIAYKRFLTHETQISKKSMDEHITITEYYTFSLETSTLYYKHEAIKLNIKQNKFLKILVKNLNHTVPFEMIFSTIWETNTIADSTLRTLVYSIRKLAPDLPLHSYSKKGYYLMSI